MWHTSNNYVCFLLLLLFAFNYRRARTRQKWFSNLRQRHLQLWLWKYSFGSILRPYSEFWSEFTVIIKLSHCQVLRNGLFFRSDIIALMTLSPARLPSLFCHFILLLLLRTSYNQDPPRLISFSMHGTPVLKNHYLWDAREGKKYSIFRMQMILHTHHVSGQHQHCGYT